MVYAMEINLQKLGTIGWGPMSDESVLNQLKISQCHSLRRLNNLQWYAQPIPFANSFLQGAINAGSAAGKRFA